MKGKYRLLVNAEPFGFGPAAAIARIVPLLVRRGIEVAYIGEKHTLDLQKDLPYSAIYDITDLSQPAKENHMKELANTYDFFFTAMDTAMAEQAQKFGMKTIVYDALTWFWRTIHPSIKSADLYIAQRFFGVEERLKAEAQSFPHFKVVSPIVTQYKQAADKTCVLLNLGGLQNPFWSFEDTLLYARAMYDAVKVAVPQHTQLVIATSASIAQALGDPDVKTYSRQEMLKLLATAKYAIMTPGLGNMYDAASFNIPTLWLPPANDSQGQQMHLLTQNNYCDEYIDWSDTSTTIDYTAAKLKVLPDITRALRTSDRKKLHALMTKKVKNISVLNDSKTTALLQKFGANGAEEICSTIIEHIEGGAHAR
jgi:hypothetical protein